MEDDVEVKDLPQDMKKELIKKYKRVNLEFKMSKGILPANIIEEHKTEMNEQGEEENIVEFGVYIPFTRENGEVEYVKIATIDEQGIFNKNREILNDSKYTDEEKAALEKIIDSIGLDHDEVDLNKMQEQLEKAEAKTKEELEQEKEGKEEETAKDDNEGKKEEEDGIENDEQEIEDDDEEKKEIAKRYHLNPNQVVHINAKGEKITNNKDLEGLVKWAKGREDIYYIPGEDPYTYKVIGRESKDDEFTEIEQANNQIHGKNPNVTIKRVDGEKITDVRPVAMYDIDGDTAMAIVKDDFNRPEVLYCRKQEGKQEYFGTVVPEVAGKNVRQQGPETRDFMTREYNSNFDLNKKADELEEAQNLEDRGVPSEEKGVQPDEIDGTHEQNIQKRKDEIVDDLYKRQGIAEKMKGAMPGYTDYIFKKLGEQADKILQLMQENENMTYEEAVEITNPDREQEENEQEEGKVPWENSKR